MPISLREYARINPIETITYALSGTSFGITLADVVCRGSFDKKDVLQFAVGGLATLVAMASSTLRNHIYTEISTDIEKKGFTNYILHNKKFRRLARIYAEENNVLDEFAKATEKYEIGRV